MSEIVPNQLFVAGYSKNKVTSENDVKDIFKGLAKIENVVYKGNYSFVVANKKIHFKNQTFNNEKDADDARQKLNGSTYQGQKLKVDIVDNRKGRRAGPTDQDECFKCGKSGHWARDCKNGGRSRSPRRRRDSYSRSRHHRKRYRSTSRSYSSPSYSSSRSPRRRRHSRRDRRSRTPRRDRKRSNSPRRHSPSGSHSKSSISKKRGSSSDSRK